MWVDWLSPRISRIEKGVYLGGDGEGVGWELESLIWSSGNSSVRSRVSEFCRTIWINRVASMLLVFSWSVSLARFEVNVSRCQWISEWTTQQLPPGFISSGSRALLSDFYKVGRGGRHISCEPRGKERRRYETNVRSNFVAVRDKVTSITLCLCPADFGYLMNADFAQNSFFNKQL